MILPRRTIIKGLIGLVAAPAIIKIDNLMKLPRVIPPPTMNLSTVGQHITLTIGDEHPLCAVKVESADITFIPNRTYDFVYDGMKWVCMNQA